MPRLLWNFDACVIPFLVNDITEATNPVKFYEYLSQGKPVVSPELTELRPFADLCYLARGHDDFLVKLRAALAEGAEDPVRAKRRAVAAANDWTARTDDLDRAVREAFPAVSVVVVTYGGLSLTRDCLRSLLEDETWPRLEVIVVDNASTDGTPAYLKQVAAGDARMKVILNERNLGFAAANNQGIRASSGHVLALLNNDTVVPSGLLGRLVLHLERDEEIGLICPTTNFCGNEAKVDPDYSDLSGLQAYAAKRAADNAGVAFDIPIAAMYCVALRREVLEKVGDLDEAFGIGMFEDDDYALRIRKAGLRVVCAEDAYVHHVGQGSFGKLSREEYDRIWKENRARFEAKWGRPWKPHELRRGVAAAVSKIS
jgi:GT2 family glycosyltransferase